MVDAERPLLGVGVLPIGAVRRSEVVLPVVGVAAGAARARINLRPLVADGVRCRVVGIRVLLGLRLHRSGERVEARTQHVDVVNAKAAANHSLVIVERTNRKTEARHEPQMRNLLEPGRIVGVAVALHFHARCPIDDCRVRVRHTIGIAGIGAGEETLRQQLLLALGVDDACRKRNAGVKVADVPILVVVARVEFIA